MSAQSNASGIENPIKMLIFATAYTSFCCFKCKLLLLLVPLNVGTARREDSPLGMSLPAPPERNIRRPFLSDVVPAK